MPRTKILHPVITYTGTDYIVNDLGLGKSSRFELYNTAIHKVMQKSNNPMDFDKWMKDNVYKTKGE